MCCYDLKSKTITNKTQEDGTYKLAQCSFGAGLLFERHATKNMSMQMHMCIWAYVHTLSMHTR